nr:MAG TPA: hypothetical protein [Caudoviricetes sp.]
MIYISFISIFFILNQLVFRSKFLPPILFRKKINFTLYTAYIE